jgi:hypothetical protein
VVRVLTDASGFGLIIPAAFYTAVKAAGKTNLDIISDKVLNVSRITSFLLLISYIVYVYFQIRTHESIYDAIFEEEGQEEAKEKEKLTLTECILALTIAITLVTVIAINLVENISFIVKERGVSDSFVGLILVPLVEKFAEHLGAIDEAWDNQMNMALAHVLGATIPIQWSSCCACRLGNQQKDGLELRPLQHHCLDSSHSRGWKFSKGFEIELSRRLSLRYRLCQHCGCGFLLSKSRRLKWAFFYC